jgi:hypothetical protein
LYLVAHDEHAALKWGIANIEQRVTQHVSQGWHLVARWEFEYTRDAWAIEREIKAWVRGQGIPPALGPELMKYRGHTETALLSDLSITRIREHIADLVGGSLDRAAQTGLEVDHVVIEAPPSGGISGASP